MAEQAKDGDTPSSFLALPVELRSRIVCRYLPVTSFRSLSSTCRELYNLWDDDSMWKRFIKRDFGKDAVADARRSDDGSKYKNYYISLYLQRKEEERRRRALMVIPEPVPQNPPPNVTDPTAPYFPQPSSGGFPGVIGGDYDLNPFEYPPGGEWPRPGNLPPPFSPPQPPFRPHNPFQPRIRPVRPFDPDSGLFGPRPPGRYQPRGPPPNVTDPTAPYFPQPSSGGFPGVIGGDYDSNPSGSPPGGEWPRPGNLPPPYRQPQQPFRPHNPFQPRIRPVTPFDPDAGLFGPRPPGRYRPSGPFGGGSNFPGFL